MTNSRLKDVIHEMNELAKCGITIPDEKFDIVKIRGFFGDFDGGVKEQSSMIDAYLMV